MITTRVSRCMFLVSSMMMLAACDPGFEESAPTEPPPIDTVVPSSSPPASTVSVADPLAELADQCRQHTGVVSLVGLPAEWLHYGQIIEAFNARFPGLVAVVDQPAASSSDVQALVAATLGTSDAPDSVEVSAGVIDEMANADLLAPFTPSVADQLLPGTRGPGDRWMAPYVLPTVFVVNRSLVASTPSSWASLDDPAFHGMVALAGDPRLSPGALAAVMGAAIANGGGADDIAPGIEFFSRLAREGILTGTNGTPESAASGETPVVLDWGASAPVMTDAISNEGLSAWSVLPADGVAGAVMPTAVVRAGADPACGQLWSEFLLSDEAGREFASAGALPSRWDTMNPPPSLGAAMQPLDAELMRRVVVPTAAQWAAARTVVERDWANAVAG
jgi:putative spermidine/putrescine transport system substrate-binding protein